MFRRGTTLFRKCQINSLLPQDAVTGAPVPVIPGNTKVACRRLCKGLSPFPSRYSQANLLCFRMVFAYRDYSSINLEKVNIFSSNMRLKPLFHCGSALFGHRKCFLALHFAFFIAKWAMPVFCNNGALLKIHLFGPFHLHHIGLCAEAECTAGAGEGVIHRKGMKCWDKEFIHAYRSFVSSSISSNSSSNSCSAWLTGSGVVMSTPAPFSRSMGLLEQPPDKNPI